jgi:hypothetical protein
VKRPETPRVAVRNAGDRDQVKRAGESDRARLERERNEEVAIWNTYEGRAFTRRLLAECGIYTLSMAQDPHWTSFNEGGRNVGLRLMARMLETAPDAYALMEREHAERESREPRAAEHKDNTEDTDAGSN